MDTSNMIFRSVALEHDVDDELKAHADRTGMRKGAVYRLFLETGLAQFEKGVPLPEVSEGEPLPLRAVHVLLSSDETLRVLAYQLKIEKGELTRRMTKLGMLSIRAGLDGFQGGER